MPVRVPFCPHSVLAVTAPYGQGSALSPQLAAPVPVHSAPSTLQGGSLWTETLVPAAWEMAASVQATLWVTLSPSPRPPDQRSHGQPAGPQLPLWWVWAHGSTGPHLSAAPNMALSQGLFKHCLL